MCVIVKNLFFSNLGLEMTGITVIWFPCDAQVHPCNIHLMPKSLDDRRTGGLCTHAYALLMGQDITLQTSEHRKRTTGCTTI